MVLKMGRVTSTKIEDGVCLLAVQMDRQGVSESAIPVLSPMSGITYVPEEGDMVALEELYDGRKVCVGVLNRAEFEQPEHGEQEFSFVLDEDTQFSFVKGENGYDVTISTTGSVTIDSDDVSIGEGNEGVVVDLDVSYGEEGVSDVSPVYSENARVD